MLFHNRITVSPGHTVLAYRGTAVQALPAGRHRVRKPDATFDIDLRERLIPVAPQEVLTADSMSVRVSMTLRACVIDAVAFVERSADPIGAVYLAAQVALREVCAGVGSDDLIRRGEAVDVTPIRAAAAEVAGTVGLEVLEVVIRDVIVPAEVRTAARGDHGEDPRAGQARGGTRGDRRAARAGQRGPVARCPPGTGPAAPRRGGALRRPRRPQRRRRRGGDRGLSLPAVPFPSR